jgi:hypothetical protein
MKTQLLEDIAQSAELPSTPAKSVGHSTAGKEAQQLAPAGDAQPARPRSAVGVWRQKPAGEPLASPAPPAEEPPPLELNKVFEEIAALEAQLVHPAPGPAIAAVEPRLLPPAFAVEPPQVLPASAAEDSHHPASPQDEVTLVRDRTQGATAPQGPLFDFTLPLPPTEAADPFTPAPHSFTRSRRRYLPWAACLLAGALLILGGRWLYQERNDAGSPALIASEAKGGPRVDPVVKGQAMAAQASAREPGAGGSVSPAVPPSLPASSPSPSAPPPLVMLEPDPPAAARVEQPSPEGADRAAPKPAQALEESPASPLPKPSIRKAREGADAAAEPAREKPKREPARQLARASAIETERPPAQESSMAATLRACREHGYHATQCIKRECSVTAYGFACRGR